jgi:lupus La protein
MSNLEAEITEPEPGPAATSLSNDETAKKEAPEPTAPTDKGVVPTKAESEDVKSAAEVTDEQKTVKSEATTGIEEEKSNKKIERNGSSEKKERFDDNGVLKTSAKIYESDVRRNYSKYDPAVLPTTDDPSKIRAQVCSNAVFITAFNH